MISITYTHAFHTNFNTTPKKNKYKHLEDLKEKSKPKHKHFKKKMRHTQQEYDYSQGKRSR